MAGMLPGVEAARRRRFHQKSSFYYGSEISPSPSSSTRRSSFCLYASSHEFNLCSSNSSMQRNHALCDESRLGTEAREAKKRLDERLQAQWRSETKRRSDGGPRFRTSLQEWPLTQAAEVPKMKRSGSKKLSWLKLSWKSSGQEECAVCLEQLKVAAWQQSLMQLPCGHRFHSNCLVPWLEANAHCPCCRMEIPS